MLSGSWIEKSGRLLTVASMTGVGTVGLKLLQIDSIT